MRSVNNSNRDLKSNKSVNIWSRPREKAEGQEEEGERKEGNKREKEKDTSGQRSETVSQ